MNFIEKYPPPFVEMFSRTLKLVQLIDNQLHIGHSLSDIIAIYRNLVISPPSISPLILFVFVRKSNVADRASNI